jgi:hypothetical protein
MQVVRKESGDSNVYQISVVHARTSSLGAHAINGDPGRASVKMDVNWIRSVKPILVSTTTSSLRLTATIIPQQ